MDRVLGIEVSRSLWTKWWTWFAPESQLFVVDSATAAGLTECSPSVAPQLAHTFLLWRIKQEDGVAVWLDEKGFSALPHPTRAALVRQQVERRRGAVPSVGTWADLIDPAVLGANGDGRRFVWWPSMATGAKRIAVLCRAVEHDQLLSRHREVAAATWKAAAPLLPRVRELAGTFAATGEHNCFGTVMAAAGDHDPSDTWVDREAIERWLTDRTEPARRSVDSLPGTVLVWRAKTGEIDHTAITIGGGWAFEKASQDWWRPRVVLAIDDLIRSKRSPGYRLQRRSLQ